jgi:hypothetical protein
MYYRYYHDPGDHNTRAHYGVRTRTHKVIYFWSKDQWDLFDLVNDPHELDNLYGLTASLKAELSRLKREVRAEDQLSKEQLPDGVDGSVASLRGK